MLIGYARVSTQDQTLRLQHDALTAGGCEKLSGTRTTLPAREKLLAFARKGDVVVVWKLDRLGRSLRDLIDVVNSLQDRGVGLRSLQEAIDTTTPAGKLTFHIFAALAEFERDMICERTRAGLSAAHKRGVAIGRPRALTPEQILIAEAMTADPAISTRQVAEQFGIHRSMTERIQVCHHALPYGLQIPQPLASFRFRCSMTWNAISRSGNGPIQPVGQSRPRVFLPRMQWLQSSLCTLA